MLEGVAGDPAGFLELAVSSSEVCRACRQMLVHPAAGCDPAASGQGAAPVPEDGQPWSIGEGRRGGTMHECCCLCVSVLQSFSLAVDLA